MKTQGIFDLTSDAQCYQRGGVWHVALNTTLGPIIVRPQYPGESLSGAFRLVYDVYCEEMRLIDHESLPPEMRATKSKWDTWDYSEQTLHLLATVDGAVIGRMRLIRDGALGIPLTNNGFALKAGNAKGDSIWEASKLILEPKYRANRIVTAFYWLAYQLCYVEGHVSSIYLSCELALRPFYQRIGAVEIGQFFNKEFGRTYCAMRVNFVEAFERQRHGGGRKRDSLELVAA